MTFVHLEDRLQEGGEDAVKSYLEVFDDLREPTRTVLGYTLDIASLLANSGLSDQYIVFGGYAVLSHLMHEFGESVAKVWRGSTDIDMGGTDRVINAIKGGFNVRSDSLSPNLCDKRTIKLTEDVEDECKIDFYTGELDERYGTPCINEHFGIPLRVVAPLNLIATKLNTPRSELTHSYDILTMLRVLEERKISPEKIVSHFDSSQRGILHERVAQGYSHYGHDRLGFIPSEDFVNEVRKRLHKLRGI